MSSSREAEKKGESVRNLEGVLGSGEPAVGKNEYRWEGVWWFFFRWAHLLKIPRKSLIFTDYSLIEVFFRRKLNHKFSFLIEECLMTSTWYPCGNDLNRRSSNLRFKLNDETFAPNLYATFHGNRFSYWRKDWLPVLIRWVLWIATKTFPLISDTMIRGFFFCAI